MGIFKKEKKTIGLALGGGGVLGAAHVGVLRALAENNIPIDYVSGTSIGAFVASFVAAGKGWKEIEEIAKQLKWLDVSKISFPKMGLLSNKKMGTLLQETIGDIRFEDTVIPAAMIAADITNGEKKILKTGDIASAVMASTCIPGIFTPIQREGDLLVDGGIVENIPVSPLKDFGADIIIAVDLISHRYIQKPENIIEVLLNTFDFMIMNVSKGYAQQADILITPNLSGASRVDTDQTPELIDIGYQTAKDVLSRDSIRKKLKMIRSGNSKP
ncbi:MAG: patatin-like phospholipase family protein [Candidatus Marinimicrobia bacterium]|nr:patatin-like phospholipase family protein [Candidatus Neomarinimicrobiota bacterium]